MNQTLYKRTYPDGELVVSSEIVPSGKIKSIEFIKSLTYQKKTRKV